IFLLIAGSTVAGPVAYYTFARDRAQVTLDRLKTWLIANNSVVMAVLLLVIGAKLVGDGISILSG
ncbi:MAG: GAP family protein, partial [Solirubrobacterales bacterium]